MAIFSFDRNYISHHNTVVCHK